MAQPSTCLLLECQEVQLPGRLNYVRGGYFTRNDHDYSYTSKQYQQIRVVSKSFSDQCVWMLSLEGATLNETLCATTCFSSECNGWLAVERGPCAWQQWKIGGYPWGAPVSMRFVDASVKLAPQKPITDMIQQLTRSVVDLREDYKKDTYNNQERQEGIFKAICQRHETTVTNVLQHSATIVAESRTMMEEHVQEALRIEIAVSEERSKMHAAEIKAQLDQFQASAEVGATYRETIYTDHQLATDKRLQDSEARASDKQEKHRQEVAEVQEENLCLVKDQLVKSGKIEARVQDLDGKVMHIEASMKEKIIQTMLELIQQRRAFQLENGTVVQLVNAPQHEPAVEADTTQDDMAPDWCEDELESVDKEGDVADEVAPERKERIPIPRRRRSLTPIQRRLTLRSRSRKHRSGPDVERSRRGGR